MAASESHDGTLIMDSGASHHVVCSAALLSNIRKSDTTYAVKGLFNKPTHINVVGDFHPFGVALFVPEGGRNLISTGRLTEGYPRVRTVFTDGPDGDFTCEFESGEVFELSRSEDRLYSCAFETAAIQFAKVTPATVAQREVQFDKAARARAKEAKEASRVAAFIPPGDLAYAINSGSVLGAHFGSRDIAAGEYIYGAGKARLSGTSTRAKLERNLLDADGRKATQKKQELHTDLFHLDGYWFILSIVVPMGQMLVDEVSVRRTKATVLQRLKGHISLCQSHGFEVPVAVVDEDAPLVACIGKIPGTVVVPVAQGQHVQKAERQIRTIKGRSRAVIAPLPYKLPGRCKKFLVKYVVQSLNAFPRRSLGPVAPNELFTGRKFDFSVDGICAFGDLVAAYESETDNLMSKRVRFCIVMCRASNLSRNWILMDIFSGTFITRSHFKTSEPLSPEFIARLGELAAADENAERQWMADQVDFDDGAPEDEPLVEDAGFEELPRIEAAVGEPPNHFQHQAADLDAEDDRAIEVRDAPLHAAPVVPAARAVEPAERVVPIVLPAGAIGSVDVDGRRASARIAGRRVDVFHTKSISALSEKRLRGKALVNAFHMFAKEAHGKYGAKAVEGAESELRELLDRKVFTPIAPAEWSKRKTKKVVKSFLFFKEKFNTQGKLDRLKARLVAMDSSAESQLHPDKDAPTVRLESMLMILIMAGSEGRRLMGIDVGNAFLEAIMTGEDVIIELDAWVSRSLKRMCPALQPFVGTNGKMWVMLDKALYGCVQSAKLWYKCLRAALESFGFVANPYDECVFNMTRNGQQITVCCYVDDLLCSSVDKITLCG